MGDTKIVTLAVIVFHFQEVVLTTIANDVGSLAQCRIEGVQKSFGRELQGVIKATNVILLLKRVVHPCEIFSLHIV